MGFRLRGFRIRGIKPGRLEGPQEYFEVGERPQDFFVIDPSGKVLVD